MVVYKKHNTYFGYVLIGIFFACLVCFAFFISCEDKKREELERKAAERKKEMADSIAQQAEKDAESNRPCNRVGKYVYIDQLGVLHTKSHCNHINDGGSLDGYVTDEDGNTVDVSKDIKCGSGVNRVLLKDMNKSLLVKSCSYCIDDKMYEYLKNYGTLEGLFDESANTEEDSESAGVELKKDVFGKPNVSVGSVYICTGGSSKRYHCDRRCKGLSNCTGAIEAVSEEEAGDMGRTPCKICY